VTVSVVLPTLNERAYIRDCLDSLLAQDHPDIVEILVADGGSTDGTRELVEAIPGPVRLLDNPGGSAAAGLNVAWRAARGDVIVRADAHTLYAPDYVHRCVEVLEETGAENVGGHMVPVGVSPFGRAVAAVMTNPIGVGPGRFHLDGGERVEVDTVYLGAFRRSTLEALGGYDEVGIQYAAEDHELNLRLRQAGGTIVLDPTIRSWYFPRETPRALVKQHHNYGLGKASTLRKHRTLPSWRPLAPVGFVTASLAMLLLGRSWPARLGLPAAHAAALAVVATRLARDPGVAPHRAFGAMWLSHWCFGLGFLQGVGRILRGRPPESRRR
jgi:glycosyltransferase involved in cell wall biosynthesis